jgi:hypothetical protein
MHLISISSFNYQLFQPPQNFKNGSMLSLHCLTITMQMEVIDIEDVLYICHGTLSYLLVSKNQNI